MTRLDYFQMFLLSAFWGASFIMIKWAGHDFPPMWVAFMRSLFGAVTLLMVSGVLRLRPCPSDVSGRCWVWWHF